MTLREEIERAFARRQMPSEIVGPEALLHVDSDVGDALWFAGRDWHDVTWNDWEQHSSAIYFFSHDAFAYYLPSLLALSSERSDQWLWPADSLIQSLDRSPCTEGWDDHFCEQFLGLFSEEYDVLKRWLLQLSVFSTYHRHGAFGSGDNLGRAFDTVDLLQKETVRRRL